MPFVWSPAALDHLHRLYVQEGRSAAAVARALDPALSRNAVLGKVQRMGWARGKPAAASPGPEPWPAPKASRPAKAALRRLRSPFSRVIPLPKLREVALTGAPRPWTERREGECAFPVGEPDRAERQLSCCAPVRGPGVYCPAHRALMTLPGSLLTRKDEDAIAEIARRAA
jgi:GcrA cell cycle regulator